ncbi:MAG: cytochrome b/b6 domain-containing protein [Ignavibacteria bacterium]|nr:cytochrome b/b6 domain-containing protein [Ignavibacteria bacterium]
MTNNKSKRYLRMTLNERIQHFVLFISFTVLAITGFALKFPEAFWVIWLRNFFGENAFDLRGLVHRVAALVLIADSIYHLFYITFTQRGKMLFNDLKLRKSDIADLKNNIKYLLWLSKEKPRFGRFSYIEKVEYWALVWGTVIMSITGIILWFESFFLSIFSNLGTEISTIIHFYEAILATLAILVWHIYFVILNPNVFPMNKSWITGYITKEEMEKEHPGELDSIEKSEL